MPKLHFTTTTHRKQEIKILADTGDQIPPFLDLQYITELGREGQHYADHTEEKELGAKHWI